MSIGFGRSIKARDASSNTSEGLLETRGREVTSVDSYQYPLGANPYLPPRYVLGSLWVLNQNTQHGPTRSI